MDQSSVKECLEGSETVRKRWSGSVTRTIKSPPEIVWKLSSDFLGATKYVDMIDTCELVEGEKNAVGCVRLARGPEIETKEKLVAIDPVNCCYTYTIMDNNLGLVGYMATFQLITMSNGSGVVEWKFEADPSSSYASEEKFISFMSSLLEKFIQGLERAAANEEK
uniref:Bet v I/Major latex protein domain-containing protein n=1 Tax=Araucaria cunninghamii TaxID=56994 RepID=A0A0D6R079_ARACU